MGSNPIGAEGIQAIAQILERNQVSKIFSFSTCISHLLYLCQTLTTLDLWDNKIGDAGTQTIARALERNQVRYIFNLLTYISYHFSSI